MFVEGGSLVMMAGILMNGWQFGDHGLQIDGWGMLHKVDGKRMVFREVIIVQGVILM